MGRKVSLAQTAFYKEVRKSQLAFLVLSIIGSGLMLGAYLTVCAWLIQADYWPFLLIFIFSVFAFCYLSFVFFFFQEKWSLLFNPSSHPDAKQLKKDIRKNKQIIHWLAKEIKRAAHYTWRGSSGRKVRISAHFMFLYRVGMFRCIYLKNLCWVYVSRTIKVKRGRSIPIKASICLHLLSGQRICFSIGIKKIEKILGHLKKQAPFAIYGFSEELSYIWYRSREAMVQKVQKKMKFAGRSGLKESALLDPQSNPWEPNSGTSSFTKRASLKKSIIYREIQKRNGFLLCTALFFTFPLSALFLCVACFGVHMECSIHDSTPSFFGFIGFLGICLAVYQIYAFMKRHSNPFAHPSLKPLLAYGDYEVLLAMMDEELKSSQKKRICFMNTNNFKKSQLGILFTKNFLFNVTFFRFDFILYNEICWAYTKSKSYYSKEGRTGVIYLYLFLDSGREIKMRIDLLGKAYRYLQCVAPFAFYGYSAQLEAKWEKDRYHSIIYPVKERLATFTRACRDFS